VRTPNARQVVIEFYLALERATTHGNIEKARAAARSIGCSFTNAESSLWLKPFIDAAEQRQDSRQEVRQGNHEEIGRTNGRTHGLTRAVKVSLFEDPVDSSLRSSSVAATAAPAKKPRQQKLPYDRSILDRRVAILKAVWQRVQPLIGRTTTWTDWRKRNGTIAASFALGGFSPEQIVKAWEITTTADGDPVRELWLVQRKLEEISAARVTRAAHA
jgi:hypothetical protein